MPIGTIIIDLVATHPTTSYTMLFIVSFIAALAIPIPAYIALATSGALAASGKLNIYAVIVTALAGNVAADVTGFALAERYGTQVLEGMGFSHLRRSRGYKAMQEIFNSYPQTIIFTTRLITEAGPAVNILAGISDVPFRTFIVFDIIGELVYVLIFGLAGYLLGDAWQQNTGFLYKGALTFILLGVIATMAQIIVKNLRKAK